MIKRAFSWGLRAFTLVYMLFLNWQLLTPVTIVQAGGWDKLYHFNAFFILASMLTLGWQRVTTMQWVSGLLVYAATTEILQHFIPGRGFSLMDWLADALGVIAGIVLSRALLSRWPVLAEQKPGGHKIERA